MSPAAALAAKAMPGGLVLVLVLVLVIVLVLALVLVLVLVSILAHTHTHTHTHMYVYYLRTQPRQRKEDAENDHVELEGAQRIEETVEGAAGHEHQDKEVADQLHERRPHVWLPEFRVAV